MLSWKKNILQFARPSGTSRGVLLDKPSWFLIHDDPAFEMPAIGECSIIEGLSPDSMSDFESMLDKVCSEFNQEGQINLDGFPAIEFGLETLKLDQKFGANKLLGPETEFTSGEVGIPINGLVWMGEIEFMKSQIREKVKSGFTCVKLKVGSLDFSDEIALLKWVRKEYSESEIELRLDANGGFSADQAPEKLKRLSDFYIHSIEQPIQPKQWNEMAFLCQNSPIDIALDEELIGINTSDSSHMTELLETIKPQYIILKPSLVGGLAASDRWISLAESMGIGWWLTSALESNVGLNAIAQFAFSKHVSMPQGLGTGGLFTNNFDSPLYIQREFLMHQPEKNWNLTSLLK
jgi:o-succinylbenzoate synthase